MRVKKIVPMRRTLNKNDKKKWTLSTYSDESDELGYLVTKDSSVPHFVITLYACF